MRVELVYFTGCPNVPSMRQLLRRCLEACGLDPEIVEVNTQDPTTLASYRRFSSPTVLVEGVDVLAGTTSDAEACRLEMPSEAELIAAIRGNHEDHR
jgi:hypothetical protein